MNWPPISSAASNSVTWWPRSAAIVAQARPAGPAPTTAIRPGALVGVYSSSVSWQARGLTRQLARLFWNTWSRHAWLQAMQVLISCALPLRALATHHGSRSEEHTSELQSLMRISYAVFCLKKKKKLKYNIKCQNKSTYYNQ